MEIDMTFVSKKNRRTTWQRQHFKGRSKPSQIKFTLLIKTLRALFLFKILSFTSFPSFDQHDYPKQQQEVFSQVNVHSYRFSNHQESFWNPEWWQRQLNWFDWVLPDLEESQSISSFLPLVFPYRTRKMKSIVISHPTTRMTKTWMNLSLIRRRKCLMRKKMTMEKKRKMMTMRSFDPNGSEVDWTFGRRAYQEALLLSLV